MKKADAIKRRPKRLFTKEDMDKIRSRNKDRSKDMERKVTARLNGRRTPMSGAGMIKGDGIVYLPNDNGLCVLECKVTSRLHPTQGPRVLLESLWFDKLQRDTQAMRGLGAKFGILIVKFLHIREMFCFILSTEIDKIEQYLDIKIELDGAVLNPNEKVSNWKISNVLMSTLEKYQWVMTPHGLYRIIPFSTVEKWFRQGR